MAENPSTAPASTPTPAPKAPEAKVWPTREEREAARRGPASKATRHGYKESSWGGKTQYECTAIPGCPFDTFDMASMLEHLAKAHAALPS